MDDLQTLPKAEEPPKPSIFEVLAVESLTIGLRDAFRHFTKILAENFPHRFSLLFQYFEELYTLVEFVFQFVHFRLHGGSFAEHFYNLMRAPDARNAQVSKRRILALVSLLTVLPYLRLQLENLFKKISDAEYNGTLNLYKDNIKRLALFYKSLYPWLHFSWESAYFCYYFAYAMGKSKYHSPLFHLAASQLVKSDGDDFVHGKDFTEYNRMRHTLWRVVEVGVGGITLGLAAGAYMLQFLGWWYGQDSGSSMLYPMPVPPPPPKWPTEQPSHICPLCLKKRTNDTALSSSGFVFCYPCIFTYVQVQKRCPITGYPATLNELVKIYHQEV